MFRRWQSPVAAGGLLAGLLSAGGLAVADAPRPAAQEAAAELPARYRDWLAEVDLLIGEAERRVFLALGRDYQRDAFIRRFWSARDPYPRTTRNELQEAWTERAEEARQRYGGLSEDRAKMLLLNGEPEDSVQAFCSELLRPLEIWFYSRTERIRDSFALVFVASGGSSRGPFRLWYPSQGPEILFAFHAGPAGEPGEIFERIDGQCPRSGEILAGLASALDWGRVEQAVEVVPRPGEEWLRTFVAYSTDLPEGAPSFAADLGISFPGRHQSRTVVQGLLSVPLPDGAALGPAGRSFVLDGELLRKGELFEHFRYRYHLRPGDLVEGRLPLVFERSLRPGEYALVVKLEDLESHAFFRLERPLSVPGPATVGAAEGAAPVPAEQPAPQAGLRLAEANLSLASGDSAVELFEPAPGLLVGRALFEALAVGERLDRVAFELNGKRVLAKRLPPYSVELDLGPAPRLHRLRAVVLDEAGRELAADELLLNAGPHRFAVRLIEPRPGRFYVESLRAAAAVDVPEGESFEKLELYLDDRLMTTLYQPPFAQPILLPRAGALHVVRAVAYLAGGNASEDAVVINAPDFSESMKVRFVELYTTVLDGRGRPVEGLSREDFTVLEEGKAWELARFERVVDQPIWTGVLIDTSSSMVEELDGAVRAALSFFHTVMTPKDRASVITFAERPSLAVPFTSDPEVLAGGVAGLTAAGETALYDALVYGLYTMSGISGQRALIVLSDGEDVRSRFGFEDAIDYARRTGVALYTVGINLGTRQQEVRSKLQRLASETGGLSFLVDGSGSFERVYKAIEAELRSQYLLAYQISTATDDDRFRQVEVRMSDPSLTAKTVRGYYP